MRGSTGPVSSGSNWHNMLVWRVASRLWMPLLIVSALAAVAEGLWLELDHAKM